MQTPSKKAIMSFVKYLIWTGIAAAIQAALVSMASLDLPLWAVPLIASALKGVATWVATKAQEYEP